MQEILDIFGIDWRLLIVQAFNFGVLLLALWYFLYRPVVGMIESRRQKIEEGVRQANAAEEKLEEVRAAESARLSAAEGEADRIVGTAREQAKGEASSIVEEANKRREGILEEASARAQEEKRRALAESKEEIAKMAVLGAEKVLRERVER